MRNPFLCSVFTWMTHMMLCNVCELRLPNFRHIFVCCLCSISMVSSTEQHMLIENMKCSPCSLSHYKCPGVGTCYNNISTRFMNRLFTSQVLQGVVLWGQKVHKNIYSCQNFVLVQNRHSPVVHSVGLTILGNVNKASTPGS